jgi:hypothetical protein
LLAEVNVPAYHAKVLLRDQRSYLGGWVKRISDCDIPRALHNAFGELIGDVGVH